MAGEPISGEKFGFLVTFLGGDVQVAKYISVHDDTQPVVGVLERREKVFGVEIVPPEGEFTGIGTLDPACCRGNAAAPRETRLASESDDGWTGGMVLFCAREMGRSNLNFQPEPGRTDWPPAWAGPHRLFCARRSRQSSQRGGAAIKGQFEWPRRSPKEAWASATTVRAPMGATQGYSIYWKLFVLYVAINSSRPANILKDINVYKNKAPAARGFIPLTQEPRSIC